MFSLIPTDVLLRPRHIYPDVSTPAHYLAAQAIAIVQKMQHFPNLRWREPFFSAVTVPVKVSDGHVQVVCACGNYPAYDPEWQLACCFTCGAIYRQAPPDGWTEIERVLLSRPLQNTRHMLVGQTLDELRAENREHGDPD